MPVPVIATDALKPHLQELGGQFVIGELPHEETHVGEALVKGCMFSPLLLSRIGKAGNDCVRSVCFLLFARWFFPVEQVS